MRCIESSNKSLMALLYLGLSGALTASAYDPKPVPVGRYSRSPTCAAPQPEPSCEAPRQEPNCAAPERPKCPCPPPEPQSAPPEYYAPQGVFVQPPPSGTVRGPVNQTGIEGASLTFPEVTIRMPSLRFPALSRYRSNARMEMDRQSAPFVEQPAAPMQAAPAAAPAQAPPVGYAPAAPVYAAPQQAPAYAYAAPQAAPQLTYAAPQAAPPMSYAAPQAVITIPAQAMPQQTPLTIYAVPAPAAPQPSPAAAPVPTPPAEAAAPYRAPQADPTPYYRAPNCAAPDDLDAKLKRLEECERRIQLQLEAIQRTLERQVDPNCAAPHRLGMAPQPFMPPGGPISTIPPTATPLPPVEQGAAWRPAYGAQAASFYQESPRPEPIREPGRFQPLR